MHRLFDPVIDAAAGLGAGLDWKTSLQELTATVGLGVPEYQIWRRRSRPREDLHRRRPGRPGRTAGSGTGRSKKEAEQEAAAAAWHALRAARG